MSLESYVTPAVVVAATVFLWKVLGARIDSLEATDESDFMAFVTCLDDLAALRCNEAAVRTEGILRGRTRYRHANGGVTSNGVYHPPRRAPEPDGGGLS